MEALSIESTLLLVELALLIFTISLLRLHLKEEKSRQSMIRELARTTSVLTRHEYFTEVLSSLQEAKVSIFGCITGRRSAEGEERTVEAIIKNIQRLVQGGVEVRFVLPKLPDRLHIGYRYRSAGADTRYSNCVLANDLRYMVVDDRYILVGVPEVAGEKEPTKKGYKIPSMGIAVILREHYDRCWKSVFTTSYEEYVKEIIDDLKNAAPRYSLEPLAKELAIDLEELRRIDYLKITPRLPRFKAPEESYRPPPVKTQDAGRVD